MENIMKIRGALIAGSVLSLASGTAAASGFGVSYQSVSAMGTAYAGSAVLSEDATNQWYNPATLAGLHTAEVSIAAEEVGEAGERVGEGLGAVRVAASSATVGDRDEGSVRGGDEIVEARSAAEGVAALRVAARSAAAEVSVAGEEVGEAGERFDTRLRWGLDRRRRRS